MREKIFPIISIIINTFAAIVYHCHGDIRKTIYWTAAAILVASVTF